MKSRLITNDEHPMEESLINLTPLIDVVFVVLISFIVIAPMIQSEKVDLAKGSEKTQSIAADSSSLSIYVKKNNTLSFQGNIISMQELKNKLIKIKKQSPNKTPMVYHDQNASFGTYQNLKNLIESCGFDEMHIILSPK